MYAQLEFTDTNYKRVCLLGGVEVGITKDLIEKYPGNFIDLQGRPDAPADIYDWYYDTEKSRFVTTEEIPHTAPTPEPKKEPTNTELSENQLILMEAMATQYEESLANRLNDMEVQATIYETVLAIQEGGAV